MDRCWQRSLAAALLVSLMVLGGPPSLVQESLAQESTATTSTKPPPSLIEIARLPSFAQPELSPSGEWLAWFGRAGSNRALIVKRTNIAHDKASPAKQEAPYVISDNKWTLLRFNWLSDDRLLLHVSIPQMRDGVPLTVTRLMLVTPAKSKIEQMLRKDTNAANHQIQDSVVSTLPGDPSRILLQVAKRTGVDMQVQELKLKSGRLNPKVVQGFRKEISNWRADLAGEVRVGSGVSTDEKQAVLRIKDSAGKWKQFPELANVGGFRIAALPVDRPGVVYAISDHEHDLGALYEFDVDNRQFGKILAQNDDSEIAGVALDPTGKTIESVYFSNEFVPNIYNDRMTLELTAKLKKLLPTTTNSVVSASDNRQLALVRSYASNIDPHYYLFNLKTSELGYLVSEYSDLAERSLAKTELFSYKARDGLEIPAYITLPAGMEFDAVRSVKPQLPFIVLPHGGPHARDFLRFDWLVQLFASRGYGVLQMNFRGSTGYGREFMLAGKGNWGKSMQDDITDGSNWLVAEGLAHADKLCIAGGSYGGYAALMGAVKEPELYQAALSLNGVSDLPNLVRLESRYHGGRYSTRFIGRLWKDRKSLAENSPARRAAEIQIPVLLVHGEDDRVVSIRQSNQMAKALRSRKDGAPYKFVKLKDGDHFLSRGKNRLQFAEEAVAFLDTHCQ